MTRGELREAISERAHSLYTEKQEVDTSLLGEIFWKDFDEHHPDWTNHRSADQIALFDLINTAVNDGIERALVAKYEILRDRHHPPEGDAHEAILGSLTAAARRDVSNFILEWEAANI